MPQICCAGEVMVEMAATERPGLYQQGFAGDSYNTAVYLARAGLQVEYLSCLGDDALSDAICERLDAEGIGRDHLRRVPGANPGLYIISNDPDGERHFSYWRERAPVRGLFEQPAALGGIDAFYFTGITLAVTRSGLENLVDLLHSLRGEGVQVIFDPNYRPLLWDSPEQSRSAYRRILPLCDTVLPTLDDERQLWGIETLAACRDWYQQHGASEVVVKADGLLAAVYRGDDEWERRAQPLAALDTTGAGDSFNAGYLAARLQGETVPVALRRAQELAARVVQHRGAILPRTTET